MIDSMTAFAREQYTGIEGELVWELRSVNHRYLDLSIRLPEELRGLDPMVREHIGQRLQRGKVDCTLRYQPGLNQQTCIISVNKSLIQGLYTAASEVAELLGSNALPSTTDIMRWPGVLQERIADLSSIQARAASLFDQALESLALTRQREGARLEVIIRQRCQSLREHAVVVRSHIPKILDDLRKRLQARLQEILGQLDPVRIEQEIVLVAQRMDVNEELDRLLAHLDEIERILNSDRVAGRRLDFLMQELNREANTLASKINDIDVIHHAVDMKVLIEQMREQIQNLE